MKTLNYIGSAIMLTALALSWLWFSWKLTLILFLVVMGGRMETMRNEK